MYENTGCRAKISLTKDTETTSQVVLKASKDPLREVLAAVSVSCLGRLKMMPSFGDCLRDVPDFSVDLVAGLYEVEPFSLNEQGYMATEKSNKK